MVVRNPSNLAASFCLPKKDQPAPRKKGGAPPLPPVPSPRATPWDPRAARSFAFAHAACTRPGWGGGPGTRTAAVQQELHSERQPAPAAVHRKKTDSPVPQTRVRGPSHGPFCRTVLGSRSVPRSELCHALHTARTRPPETRTAPAPPRPLVRSARAAPARELTPKARTGRFRGTSVTPTTSSLLLFTRLCVSGDDDGGHHELLYPCPSTFHQLHRPVNVR